MPIDLARLRSIARGEISAADGRNPVTGSPVTPPAPPVTCAGYAKNSRSYAGYAGYVSKTQGWKSSEVESQLEAVTGGVTEALCLPLFDRAGLEAEAAARNRTAAEAGLTDRWCACGRMATVAMGSFRPDRGNPEGVARWVCCECFYPEPGPQIA